MADCIERHCCRLLKNKIKTERKIRRGAQDDVLVYSFLKLKGAGKLTPLAEFMNRRSTDKMNGASKRLR